MMTATYSPEDNRLRLYSVGRLDPETYARATPEFINARKKNFQKSSSFRSLELTRY